SSARCHWSATPSMCCGARTGETCGCYGSGWTTSAGDERIGRRVAMSLIFLLLNLLWIVFGGLWMALGWVIAAVLMAITIVGLPWARAAFNIAAYTLLPFGYKAVPRDEYFGSEDVGTGPLGVIGNIVWLLLAGWWLALGHLVTAILLALTIVGIPFAWAHLKLAGLALWPIGKAIVPVQIARSGSSTGWR